jgi:hypothetical protein
MLRLAAVLGVIALCLLAGPAAASAADRLDIGIQDPMGFDERDPAGAFAAAKANGISVVRVPVYWNTLLVGRPMHPKDPGDPYYDWSSVDRSVDLIRSQGLDPLLVLTSSPLWARPSSHRITTSGADYADFATAIARRYRGRVRYWQLWNEPNLTFNWEDTAAQYRTIVNAAYHALNAVSGKNVVVAGGLAPFSGPKGAGGQPPLRFMRDVLKKRTFFDVWAHHPYTEGGPNHKAPAKDEVSLGNLPQMHRVLMAAYRAGHVGGGRPGFWITEFSWDTKPPDPGGLPLALHARWVGEALYRAWQNDVSMFTWFQLRDNPPPSDPADWGVTFQDGLYFRTTQLYANERIKPFAKVLHFPFVALPEGGVTFWGRTADAGRHGVTIERRVGKSWRRVTSVRAGAHGIFFKRIGGPKGSLYRARAGGSTSLPFKAVRTPDKHVFAFGG